MRRFAFGAAVVAAALFPGAAFGQQLAPAAPPAAVLAQAPTVASAPMIRADVAGIQRTSPAADEHSVDAVAAAQGLHQGEGVALMAVGGAALVGGLLINNSAGTVIAISGLAVGLVGLYEYVR